MTLLHEVFHTIWPQLFNLVVTPLAWFFETVAFVQATFFTLFGSVFGEDSYIFGVIRFSFGAALLLGSGLVFLEWLFYQLYRLIKKPVKSIERGAWTSLWWLHFLAIFLINIFFGEILGDWLGAKASPRLMIVFVPLIVIGASAIAIRIVLWLGEILLSLVERFLTVPIWLRKIIKILAILLSLYPILAAVSMVIWIFQDLTPQASRFFVINAAIKNTCFIDSDRANCPQTLEEISYIEPLYYRDMTECCQVNYVYHPEINRYSLVVRYSPTQAVLFDWRLVDETGIDLKEYKVELFGQDRLKDPPAWDGPWTFPDWDYPYSNESF